MRVLADENVPEPAVAALRAHGYDVVWMHEVAAGTPDLEVLARAQREQRVLVTLDKDFGELAFRHGAAAQCGVVLVRLTAISPDVVARAVLAALAMHPGWTGTFAVVEDGRLRVRSILTDPSAEE